MTRAGLARAVCERLDWRDARGRLKAMACRKRLLGLERRGLIGLPPARRDRPGRRVAGEAAPSGPVVSGELAALGEVVVEPIVGGTTASRQWNALMEAHHPLGSGPLCGAQMRYLIVSGHHGVVGGLAVSAPAWRVRARDQALGWDDGERAAGLAGIVCNSRFLILPGVRIKHLASHVLGQLARRIGADWQQRYGVRPWLMETYVEARHSGTAYRAANWRELGMTAGRGRQDRAGKGGVAVKRVLVYPLGRAGRRRLRAVRTRPELDWVRGEFAGARLGDKRLEERLVDLAVCFAAKPQANIPQACGSRARAKAAYRFLAHERTSMDALLAPHRQATIDRLRREKLVLVVQDTSSLNYTAHPAMDDIGPIGTKRDGPQGLMLHTAFTVRPDGLPLGLLDVQCWARDRAAFGKKHKRKSTAIEHKESYKWLRPLPAIGEAARQCPGTRLVVVADRECDIYEYMCHAADLGLDVLLRAKENRALSEDERRLWPYMDSLPVAAVVDLPVPRHPKQPARTARMSVRFAPLTLAPPKRKKRLGPIQLWAVWSKEENPPPGIKKPLEWMLLTAVPVNSLEDALERLQWYARRWGIEVFHRILKSGCRIEDRQLGTADNLQACLAIDMVVAWRIHYLTHLGRLTPDLPCTVAFQDDQWKALIIKQTNKLPPEQPPTLHQMIRLIAMLGGFLGRKSDGQPGTQTLWRGLQILDDIAAAYRSFKIAYAIPP